MGWQHSREYYRVAYPTDLRPRLDVQSHFFDVIDVSEKGMRFALGKTADAPRLGDEVAGLIRFRRGEEVEVRGMVIRLDGREVAVRLEDGIPLRVIMEEQRFLLERHRYLGL
ncbi:MAG: PilZ domain-containing protein [Gemmatimonadetes bacterium]|nr:PilZ domain-containing protein [Gemmatimonadota bacterium]